MSISISMTLDIELSKCSGQSSRKPPVFSPQTHKLGAHLLKAELTFPPGLPPQTCGVEVQYPTTQPLD
ncbi:hypothetical protein TNCV_2365151 [Trichonephila clavipes]|nr:hypothetical protein TNCV_2365151 [Trichonephila clavipes]